MVIEPDDQLNITATEKVLRERAESLAKETVEDQPVDQVSLLLFRLSDEWYAVDASDVREIFQGYRLTAIPGVPNHILGVVNVRGEIISVTDPARLMGIGSVDADGAVPPAVLVVKDGVVTAMVVDEVGDIIEIPNEEIEPPISTIDRTQAEYVSGSVRVDSGMVGVISVVKMLEPVSTGTRH